MRLKLILVEPKYQINVGYVARVAKNFGIKRLYFVAPRAYLKGGTATKYSKHAHELVENALLYRNFDQAVKDCDIVVGTTGMWRKASTNFRNVLLPRQLANRLNEIGAGRKVALVIGRDDIGLTKEELEKCDLITYIGTNPEYPVLNISHALSIILFVLTEKKYEKEYDRLASNKAQKAEVDALLRIFSKSIKGKRIRNKKAVSLAFKRLVALSHPTGKEVHALMTALK